MLTSLNDPVNQRLIARLLKMPEAQQAAHDLAKALADGALDALTDEARQERIRQLSEAYAVRISGAIAHGLDEQISPRVVEMVGNAAGAAVASALSDANRGSAEQFAAGVTTASMHALAASIDQELGPAMRDAIARDLGPAIAGALDRNVAIAAGGVAREVTRQAVLGANDAMTALHAKSLGPFGPSGAFNEGLRMAHAIGIVLGLALLALLAWVVLLSRRSRRDRVEARRREAGVELIAEAIRSTDDRPWSREFCDALDVALADVRGADHARAILAKRRQAAVNGGSTPPSPSGDRRRPAGRSPHA